MDLEALGLKSTSPIGKSAPESTLPTCDYSITNFIERTAANFIVLCVSHNFKLRHEITRRDFGSP